MVAFVIPQHRYDTLAMFSRFAPKAARPAGRRAFRWAAAGAAGATTAFAGGSAVAFCAWFGAAGEAPPFDIAALRKELEALVDDNLEQAPTLVRLAWHEAGTYAKGCSVTGSPNSASMRFKPECDHGANAGLLATQSLLEPLKAKYPQCSYADLWVLASLVAIEAMGGPKIPFRWGRPDAQSAAECAPDGRLPDAAQGENHIRAVFGRMGFNDQEMVALIGAHAVGRCHADRSGFVGPWTFDPLTFSNTFFTALTGDDWLVDKTKAKLQFTDAKTRTLMMLPADMALIIDPSFRKISQEYAASEQKFFTDFAKAYQKLVELGVENKLKSLP